MEKIKTPEEILVEKYGCSDLADLQKCFLNDMISFSMIVEAMHEYGKQQYELGKASKNEPSQDISFDKIENVICDYFGITPQEIEVKKRDRKVVLPRQLCHHFASNYGLGSLSAIGFRFGRKDHATVLHSNRTINNLKETDKVFRAQYEEILNLL